MSTTLDKILKLVRYKSRLGKAVRAPLKVIPPKTIMPIIGGKLRGKRWIVGSSSHGCWLGWYERPKQEVFINFVKKGMIVYDIGAHVGFYSLLASVLIGPTGNVVAFEPESDNIINLEQHIHINEIDNIKVFPFAISNSTGVTIFSKGLSSSTGKLDDAGSVEVNSFKLDDFIIKENLPLPDVIKMDIEGSEAEALIGAEETLSRASPVIFLATHSDELESECRYILNKLGYKMELLDSYDGDEFIATKIS